MAVAFNENGAEAGEGGAGQLGVSLFEQALEFVGAGGPGVITDGGPHFPPQERVTAQAPARRFSFKELGT